jgi:hypothetical protein
VSRGPPSSHQQTIGDLSPPPHNPPAALAVATSLFTPCRGSGVATSHVSREPGAPGWAALCGAGPRRLSGAPEASEAEGLGSLSTPVKVNFVCVISTSAPQSPSSGPLPTGVFLALSLLLFGSK